MKRFIWRLKMWWWKHTNPARYYKEAWKKAFNDWNDAARRMRMSIEAFGKKVTEIKKNTEAFGEAAAEIKKNNERHTD